MTNKTLISEARKLLLQTLLKLEQKHRDFFLRMYFHQNKPTTIEEAVEKLPVDKIDWAISQAESTLKKINLTRQ